MTTPQQLQQLPKKKILVTEDEGIVALEISETLEKLGYAVVGTAQSGEEAIKLAKERKPDLVLMDIILQGDMDGIETAERIYSYYGVPVIYLTSHSDESTLRRALKTNAFGYIIKPFTDRQLYSSIEMTLHKQSVIKKVEPTALVDTTLKLVSDAIVTVDGDGSITMINPAAQSLTGYSKEEVLNKNIFSLFNPSDRMRIAKMMVTVRDTPDDKRKSMISWVDNLTIVKKNREAIPASLNIGRADNDSWNGDEYFFILIPATKRGGLIKGDESNMERYYRIVLDAIKDSMFLINASHNIVVYNKAFAELCKRFDVDLQMNKPVYDVLPNDIFGSAWDYKEMFNAQKRNAGQPVLKEHSFMVNNVPCYLNLDMIPLSDGKNITHLAVVVVDVTREKEIKERDEKISMNFRDHSKNIEMIADSCNKIKVPAAEIKRLAARQTTPESKEILKYAMMLSKFIADIDMRWVKYDKFKTVFASLNIDMTPRVNEKEKVMNEDLSGEVTKSKEYYKKLAENGPGYKTAKPEDELDMSLFEGIDKDAPPVKFSKK